MPNHDETEKIVKWAWEFCQWCLRANPVLIVGSGASAAYGLPTMGELGEYLVLEIEKTPIPDDDQLIWAEFKKKLSEAGLEQAIDSADLWRNDALYALVRQHTWEYVAGRDSIVHQNVLRDRTHLALSQLFRHLLTSTNTVVQVVTTNYDRLIEYAAEAEGYFCRTGFHSGYLGAWRGDEPTLEFWTKGKRVPQNTIEIFKVHGSLDWFEYSEFGFTSVPMFTALSSDIKPLIVPPSLRKLADTHDDPFRTVIQGADRTLRAANAFFCVGYGFNDAHIQVKLLERAKRDRKRVVLLTRSLSDRAREFFLGDDNELDFVAMETAGESGTTLYSQGHKSGIFIEGLHVWDLRHFVNEIL